MLGLGQHQQTEIGMQATVTRKTSYLGDHIVGAKGMENSFLCMTDVEQAQALCGEGFGDVSMIPQNEGRVLHRAFRATWTFVLASARTRAANRGEETFV